MNKKQAAYYALAVLFVINALNFFDRQIIGAVGEPIREEFGLSDSALGAFNTAFTLLYAFVGLPLGKLADKYNRKKILAFGVFVWSLMTAASGFARNFWQIFAMRLGVGVGEATCAPAASSLIGDYFPSEKRGKAMSVFMLGLPDRFGSEFCDFGRDGEKLRLASGIFCRRTSRDFYAFSPCFLSKNRLAEKSKRLMSATKKREGSTDYIDSQNRRRWFG